MTKIYLSGKISGPNIDYAKQNFYFSAKELKKYYGANIVINPFDIKPFLGLDYWICYMITDILALRKCDKIAMRKDWIDSRGAWLKYGYAKFILKIPVIFF